MKVVNSVLELVGETPIVKLNKMYAGNPGAQVYAKLEYFNPGGSIKDRPGLYMIDKAEEQGAIRDGSIILEATSGNTGIGLAMAAAYKGYPLVIVMPENMSEERKQVLKAYGAKLVLTPAEKGMPGAVETAKQMAADDSRYYWVRQFENHYNVESHEKSTAQEIISQLGPIDAVVCGIGSGGTIGGVARVLKNVFPDLQVVAVEPAKSAVISGKTAGEHKIQGIGAGFIPSVLNTEVIDRIICVEDHQAINTCRQLASREALLLGISSGAAIWAALQVAGEMKKNQKVLAIAPDGADKYMSTGLFDLEEGEF